MTKYKLLTISEDTLEDVSLSEDELNSINSKLLAQVEKLKNLNDNLDINSSINNLYKTISTLGSDINYSIHGIKNSNILKALVLQAIDGEICLNEEDLITKGFFLAGGGNEFSLPINFFSNETYYYQIYLTNTNLIICPLDLNFRLKEISTLPINKIESTAILDETCDRVKLPHKHLLIKLNSNSFPYSKYYLVNEDSNNDTQLELLLNKLTSLGIKEYKNKLNLNTKIFYISMIIIFIFYVYALFFNKYIN